MNRREAIGGMIGALAAAAMPAAEHVPAEGARYPSEQNSILCEYRPNTMTITALLEHGASIWIDGEVITNHGRETMEVSRTVPVRFSQVTRWPAGWPKDVT